MVNGTEPAGLTARTAPGESAGGDASRPGGAEALLERLAVIEAGIRDDRHRQPAEVVEAIARSWSAGATVRDVAACAGVSREIVCDRLHRAGALGYLLREQRRHVREVLESRGAELIAAYEAGETAEALARDAGISSYTLRTYLVARGVAIRSPRRMTRAILQTHGAELAAAYESGATIKDLSVRYAINQAAIRVFLTASGVPLRHDPGKYPRGRERLREAVLEAVGR